MPDLKLRRHWIRNAAWSTACFLTSDLQAFNRVNPIEVQTSNGRVVLEDKPNEFLFIDFWASWCPPCIEAFPWLERIHQIFGMTRRTQIAKLRVVAINLDHDKESAVRFTEKLKPSFEIVFVDGEKIARQFPIRTMPTSFLIDKKRDIRWSHQGFHSRDVARLELQIERDLNIW